MNLSECPNCGAKAEAGKKCDYCGTFVPLNEQSGTQEQHGCDEDYQLPIDTPETVHEKISWKDWFNFIGGILGIIISIWCFSLGITETKKGTTIYIFFFISIGMLIKGGRKIF